MKIRPVLTLLFAALLFVGCSTDFEVYAPEKEIRSVYCILNPDDSVQYVRVAKAYQFRGDALQYAAENDLSVKGRTVKLSSGNKTWTAIEVPDVPKDSGDFYPYHTLYKFITDGSGAGKDTLKEGDTYKLEVGAPEETDYVFGETTIPLTPRIKGELNIVAAAGSSKCLPTLALERKFNMFWTKGAEGVFYEVRVKLEFERNGIPQEAATWGPTELFDANKRCNEGTGNICYQFAERELLRAFLRKMPEDGSNYTYNVANACVPNSTLLHLMPKSLKFEVTAVDEKLSNYIQVNNPKFQDLTGTKPEYTNISGNLDAVGVFGSIALDRKYAVMNDCSVGLLDLNGQAIPPGCTWE